MFYPPPPQNRWLEKWNFNKLKQFLSSLTKVKITLILFHSSNQNFFKTRNIFPNTSKKFFIYIFITNHQAPVGYFSLI